jgi:hypothetical protein
VEPEPLTSRDPRRLSLSRGHLVESIVRATQRARRRSSKAEDGTAVPHHDLGAPEQPVDLRELYRYVQPSSRMT